MQNVLSSGGMQLQFQYQAGAGPMSVSVETAYVLNDDKWHSVLVERNRKEARMIVDGGGKAVLKEPSGPVRAIHLESDFVVGEWSLWWQWRKGLCLSLFPTKVVTGDAVLWLFYFFSCHALRKYEVACSFVYIFISLTEPSPFQEPLWITEMVLWAASVLWSSMGSCRILGEELREECMGFMQAVLASASPTPALTMEPAMRAIPPMIVIADGLPSRDQFVLMVSSLFTFYLCI